MTFAVIKTGGKQYKVAANDVVKIEKLEAAAGDVVTFDQVLMVGNGDDVTVGAPLIEGALVAGQLIETKKQRTVIILKKQRRQHFDRRNGHRQSLSTVRITEILVGGAKPTTQPDERARARAAAKAEAAAALAGGKARPAASVAAAPKVAKPAGPKAKAAPKTAAEEPAAAAKTPAKKAAEFVDDLKLIGGVGPALEKRLHEAGITSLKQIAGWKKAEAAEFDEKLDFKGRIEREEWVAQAKDLVAGKPPRAKVDQEAAADEKAAAKTRTAAKKAAPKAEKE
ncbi:MAG: 50S ribosomal protein L21 [Thiobacillus sp.]|uniref:50S ribosomal protein L21 n=1 Tax=Thiobacillus sp. TaxID=924 RepID=UPI0028958F8D|nr:50S ribosomal protein L21 [Thiobacillus sp.]MDT3707239.1 50S ribosomal protein L21 [Thiobacillus sp.]